MGDLADNIIKYITTFIDGYIQFCVIDKLWAGGMCTTYQ